MKPGDGISLKHADYDPDDLTTYLCDWCGKKELETRSNDAMGDAAWCYYCYDQVSTEGTCYESCCRKIECQVEAVFNGDRGTKVDFKYGKGS